MFVGHLGVALAGSAVARRRRWPLGLGSLVAAALWLDLLWPWLLFAGLERVRIDPGNTAFTPLAFDAYPWSHSLAMVLVWSALGGLVVAWRRRSRAAGLLVGALILSHWVLDLAAHRADLPLWPGDAPRLGLGLWHSIPATFLVEGALFAAGIWIYLDAAAPRSRSAARAFWSLMAACAILWIAQPLSPPPPGPAAVAAGTLALWILPGWAAWADRDAS